MNDSSSPLTSGPTDASSGTLESLWEAHNSLRNAFHVALLMLLILAGSLFVFFLREVSLARRQSAELAQMVNDYEKNAYPAMEKFRDKLQQFTQTHPDFAPIYTKYFGSSDGLPGANGGRGNTSPARLPPVPGR